jgi:DNA-binding HxlR family transcriptional regulator
MIYQGKELHIEMNGRTYHCALDVTMNLIGGKWKAVILWYLRKTAIRFSELGRKIPNITDKMLSLQLRQMEKDGFVGRKLYPEVPPRVEYYLTDEGKKLIPLLEEMARWGRRQVEQKGNIVETETGKRVNLKFRESD